MAARTITFDESIWISAPVPTVYAVVAEPMQMIGLQPLLTRCEIQSQHIDEKAGNAEYEVYFVEHFHMLGPIGYDNRIRVLIDANTARRRVRFTVQSFPRIRLLSEWVMTAEGTGTRVTESVVIISPGILANFVFKTAREAQRKILANLKQRCESTNG